MHHSTRRFDRTIGVSKRDLGLCYFLTAGGSLCVVIGGGVLTGVFPAEVLIGFPPSLALAAVVYWLPRDDLDGEAVWRIAQWGGLGIGLLTLLSLGALWLPVASRGTGVFLSSNVALGGLAGVLVGTVRVQRERIRSLREKHSVLARVLRHDLRNGMALVCGHADTLERIVPEEGAEHVRTIEQVADDLADLSDDARRFQRVVEPDHELEPVDVVSLLRSQIERLRIAHPEAELGADLPGEAWVYADGFLDSAIDDLLSNAVEHNDDTPEVCVSVTSREGRVEVRIADDGPGIPDREVAVHDGGRETQLEHSTGTGLWLVRWLVESYGGEIDFECEEEGTTVRLELPRAPGA